MAGAHTLILWGNIFTAYRQSTTDPLYQRGDTQLLVSAHFLTGVFPQRESHHLGKCTKTREKGKAGKEEFLLLKQFQQNYNYC